MDRDPSGIIPGCRITKITAVQEILSPAYYAEILKKMMTDFLKLIILINSGL